MREEERGEGRRRRRWLPAKMPVLVLVFFCSPSPPGCFLSASSKRRALAVIGNSLRSRERNAHKAASWQANKSRLACPAPQQQAMGW